ncbi:hypothetical protein DCS_05671 [Drechmeria coniospora]|uniref:Mis6 domain-containing protein n=1 Tax=Drechmeria coniospora TaxID=98403 RepID=A0A151GNF4_DRECN|nr:hypothetical protein DCS_05671 [Drechmeria coniospora]KYK58654.1 hypothetical protein DCS_05671 [Drechmeria coniospora]
MTVTTDEDVNALVHVVVSASKLPAKSRSTAVKPVVAQLASLCYERGLLPDALGQLVDLLTSPSYLDQASLQTLARNLYPRGKVEADVVLRILGTLGHGRLKMSLGVQAALLRWLILVQHDLQEREVLARAYGFLFGLLDTAAIRLNLSRQTGNDPCLVGLLRVFKDYYPEIIVGDAHPDPAWRARLDEIQEAHRRQVDGPSSALLDGFRVNRPMDRTLRNRLLPAVHTPYATEDSVTLEEIENVRSFVQKLEKLELPNQLVAVLADPLLQKLLLLRPDATSHRRVSNWLGSVLQDVLDGDADEGTLWEVLEVVREFVVQTKTLPPVLLGFFCRFFEVWSGEGRRDLVLDILSYAPLQDFQELSKFIFGPLEACIQDDSPDTQRALLGLYTSLLHYWTSVLESSSTVPPDASQAISSLLHHVNRLNLTLLQTAPSLATEAAILSFYECTIPLLAHPTLQQHVRIELPPSPLVYSLFFSASLASVSRLSLILARFKKGFEKAMATRPRGDGSNRIDASSYTKAYVNHYNGFLMDMCNCLWRARAFSDSDSNAHGCMVPRATVSALTAYVASVDKSFTLASLFSLSHSPVLCLQSIRCVRDLEDKAMAEDLSIRTRHAGPVTQNSLSRLAASGGVRLTWQEYRISVLERLTREGLPGITELLTNTMTVLKNSMDDRSRKQMATSSPHAGTQDTSLLGGS